MLDGKLTLGDLSMFLVYLAMLLEPVAMLASSVTSFQSQLAGFDRILDLHERAAGDGREPRSYLRIRKADVSGRITINGLGFTYPGGDRPVLSDIDLDVEPGETIALVGRSGSEQDHRSQLDPARFYDPARGTILLDGTDLRTIEVESFQRPASASSNRTSSSSTAQSPRTSPTRPARPRPRRSSTPRGSRTRRGSSRPCPRAMTP